jgi:hypothetical protein
MEQLKMINGKYYPLWNQFIIKKAKWIGGVLQDEGTQSDPVDMALGEYPMMTEIIDIRLRPNGVDSAFFEIVGKDFTCGFDVQYGGISGQQIAGWLTFHGYGGHIFRINSKD